MFDCTINIERMEDSHENSHHLFENLPVIESLPDFRDRNVAFRESQIPTSDLYNEDQRDNGEIEIKSLVKIFLRKQKL